MKKITMIVLALYVLNISNVFAQIKDIENHWAKEEIIDSIENGYASGYSDETFKPNNVISMNEFIKILIKSMHVALQIEDENVWPNAYIKTAIKHELIQESELKETLTRNDATIIIARYLKNIEAKSSKNKLKDVESKYSKEVSKLVSLKIISGYEDGTFRGDSQLTRAEALVMIKRAVTQKREKLKSVISEKENWIKYTNLKNKQNENLLEQYEIQNVKLLINDEEISTKVFPVRKIIKVIKSLINEEGYTYVKYQPNEVSQLKIIYGENEHLIEQQMYQYVFTYYANGAYPLKEKTGIESFKEDCYMKIELVKLWREISEFEKGNEVDEYEKNRLKMALEAEFGESHSSEILKYMLQKYHEKIQNRGMIQNEFEEKHFGKYIFYYYQIENEEPVFYITEKS